MLEEAVYWFTRQSYPECQRELIICHDAANMELICNVPRVRVVKINQRLTLGEKYNYMTDIAKGEVFFPWEDDDISLTNRIRYGILNLRDFGVDYYSPKMAFFQVGAEGKLGLCSPHSVHHNCSAYTRYCADVVRYRDELSGPQDMEYQADVLRSGAIEKKLGYQSNRSIQYVYRWACSNNLSANVNHYLSQPEPRGRYVIEPKMYRDYEKEVTEWIEKNSTDGPQV
jgi:hypothetical protein